MVIEFVVTSESEFWGLKFGDWLNIISLILTLAGLAWTIYTAKNAEKAAIYARNEAINATENSRKVSASSELGSIIKSIEYIKTLNRVKINRQILLMHYAEVAKALSHQAANPIIRSEDRVFLQECLISVREFEADLEESLDDPQQFDVISANKRLSEKMDRVVRIMVSLSQHVLLEVKG